MKTNFTIMPLLRTIFLPCILLPFYLTTWATTHTIHVANFSFTPANTNAIVGDTIIWSWVSGSHTTTSTTIPAGATAWSSPMNSSSMTFQYIVVIPGLYHFHCAIHSSMTGTINVSAAVVPITIFQMGFGLSDSTSDAEGASIQQTFDGGFISAGYISNFGGGSDDFYVVKTDANGVVAWTRSYGGANADDANAIIQTSDSGYALAGPSLSFGGEAILLIKTDASGTILWSKTYGTGDTLSDASAFSLKQTKDGGYILTGYTSKFGAGGDDYYLVKTNASGDISWTKTYGGAGNDDANSVAPTKDGGYIICGTTTSFADTTGDIYLVKTDSTGTLQWSRDFGSNDGMDMANSVQQTADGGYIIGGVTMGPALGEFATLIKTDSVGQIVWTKAYGIDTTSSDASAASVQQTADGGYVLTGYTSNFGAGSDDYLLAKTNASGDLQWAKTYGSANADDALAVVQTTDGGYVVSGKTFGFPVSGLGQHLYMVKTDSMGNSPCNQGIANMVVDTSVVFSVFPTQDSVSTGGVATSVTPTVSSGGVAADLCSVTAVNELTMSTNVNVYPNPSSGQFQVISSRIIQTIEVYDVMGARILSMEVNSDRTELNLGRQASGIYFIRLTAGSETDTKKIIIEN